MTGILYIGDAVFFICKDISCMQRSLWDVKSFRLHYPTEFTHSLFS